MTGVVRPLDGLRVVDLSHGIAGGYLSKILVDSGADVVRVEPPGGSALRRWSASGTPLGSDAGVLFRFLAAGSTSLELDLRDANDRDQLRAICGLADVVIETFTGAQLRDLSLDLDALRSDPSTTLVSITPFGRTGPWSERPATEFTLQAWSGAMGQRGDPAREPLSVGGRTGEWIAGSMAATSLLASLRRTRATGRGEHLDVSILEAVCITHVAYPVTFFSMAGIPFKETRYLPVPCIEPTKDGWVGLFPLTGQQWLDFFVMIERFDWLEDESLLRADNRIRREAELREGIEAWTTQRTTDEIIEFASALRIPVTPIGNGATVAKFDQMVETGLYVENPGGFTQPRVPHVFHGHSTPPPQLSPAVGEGGARRVGAWAASPSTLADGSANDGGASGDAAELPLAGVRVADFTAFWAGPFVGTFLANLGAEVIHVESIQRPDGFRTNSICDMGEEGWWEKAPLYQGTNTGKKDLTLDLSRPEGIELAKRLIRESDVVLENFTPRVMEQFGLDYETMRALRPDVIFVRMPAFGLTGPWRDRTGFAQTMEQASGLGWITGYRDGRPEIPMGPCDPVAGTHATIGLLLAIEHRRQTGEGMLVEVPMVCGALNIAAEQVLEHSAYGQLLQRDGNRAPHAAPQGVYLAADVDASGKRDTWVAVSVETEAEWENLRPLLEAVGLEPDPSLGSLAGRRAAHDRLDTALSALCGAGKAADVVERLAAAGVPAAVVVMPHEQHDNPQLQARGFFEELDHPYIGRHPHCTYPTRFSNGPSTWNRSPSPTLGQHNHEVLTGLLGLSDDDVARLEAERIIGTRPVAAAILQ